MTAAKAAMAAALPAAPAFSHLKSKGPKNNRTTREVCRTARGT